MRQARHLFLLSPLVAMLGWFDYRRASGSVLVAVPVDAAFASLVAAYAVLSSGAPLPAKGAGMPAAGQRRSRRG
jgi:hypothetical protein